MKVSLIKSEFTDSPAQYVLNLIMNQLGYFFEWQDNPSASDPSSIVLFYAPLHTPKSWQQPTIILPRIIPLEETKRKECLWSEIQLDSQLIPIIGQADPKEMIVPSNQETLSFDLVANVYFHLTRIEETSVTHPDQMNLSQIERSILFKYGQFKRPVVDILTDWLGEKIAALFAASDQPFLRKAAFPNGEDFGVALTHDVDFVRAFHPIKKFLLKTFYHTGLYRQQTPQQLDAADRDFWAFDRLLAHYRQLKWQATFFFIPRYREGWHFRYRIGAKRFKKLFQELKADGHEIAFHPSRFAFEHPGRYRSELNKLERTADVKISGVRCHYLRCLFPAFWNRAQHLGLNYDATLAFAQHRGFRAGSVRPFTVFDHHYQQPIDIIEFSTPFMENTLPKSGNDVDDALRFLRQMINTVKKHHGVLTTLWHSNNCFQPANYQKIWQRFQEMIQAENAFLAPLYTHAAWIRMRQQIIITGAYATAEGWRVNFSLPAGLQIFTLLASDEKMRIRVINTEVNLQVQGSRLTLENKNGLSEIGIEVLR